MARRRIPLVGLLAVLLALIGQLAAGASVPRPDPLGRLLGAETLCHTSDDSTPSPSAPDHPLDCLVCPLCIAVHAPLANLVPIAAVLTPPSLIAVRRAELPPPSTAPPSPHRPPAQPRAPPANS